MTARRTAASTTAMLDLWRPPPGAGEPVGCLATTYTFAPALFDEQCLARFLKIDSEPNREGLAFLLERETRLGAVYAGVLVDHTQAGVEHSLRWDVLPVRLRAGTQHAKLSLLAWTAHLRLIVTSANLTDPGYRTNHEVAGVIDLTPTDMRAEPLRDAVAFLQGLLQYVPAVAEGSVVITRARAFLRGVERQTRRWAPRRGRAAIRHHLVFTMPGAGAARTAVSALDDALRLCRARGGAPSDVRVASPFFDDDTTTSRVAAALGKAMARGTRRHLRLAVPVMRDDAGGRPRLLAPRAMLTTAEQYVEDVVVEALPDRDTDRNSRIWHAKMLGLSSAAYSAVMIGSSNFTAAGMGVGGRRNAEANLLTIIDTKRFSQAPGRLERVWPPMDRIVDPDDAEWLGALADRDEEAQAACPPAPPGFLAAIYRAGVARQVVLQLEPGLLPAEWQVHASGREAQPLLSSTAWQDGGRAHTVRIAWTPLHPPERLLVCWAEHEAFLPLNVEDQRALPPPAHLEQMTADDMLEILAASDPGAAFRAWVARLGPAPDDDLDTAVPADLDPLRQFDLQATYLHRVRRRARVLAQMRANLQRPAAGPQAIEWRLRGLIGIQALADRLAREVAEANGTADEALLTLADFLIVLRDVEYEPGEGGLARRDFEGLFRPFLGELADSLAGLVRAEGDRLSPDVRRFWARVVTRCRE